MGGDEVRLAALEGLGDAEETDNVGVVGVEELAVDFLSLACQSVL
jgi:hypothetical protein